MLSALLAGDLRQWRFPLRKLLLRGRWKQTFPDRLLPSKLAGPANGFRFFARLSLRRLLIGASLFHFSEDALALHLLLQNTKRLVDIVVPDKYLQLKLLAGAANCGTPACSQLRRSLVAIMRMRVTAYLFAGLEQAVLFVTAIQFSISDVTTLARPCQSIKPSHTVTGPFEAARLAPKVPR